MEFYMENLHHTDLRDYVKKNMFRIYWVVNPNINSLCTEGKMKRCYINVDIYIFKNKSMKSQSSTLQSLRAA